MASAGGSLTRRRVSVKLFFVALAMPYLAQCGKGGVLHAKRHYLVRGLCRGWYSCKLY